MLRRLLVNQLGGLVNAALTLNTKAAEQGAPPVFEFRLGVPQFNTKLRLTPAPRFVIGWTGIRLTQVYFTEVDTGREFTIKL